MYWKMKSQFSCFTETLWAFTANIRLHGFMSLTVYLEVITADNDAVSIHIHCMQYRNQGLF